jgi:competence protein ComEC
MFSIAVLLLLFIVLIRLIRSTSIKGVIIIFTLYLCGFWITQNKLSIPDIASTNNHYLTGQIVSYPIKKDSYTKFIVKSQTTGHKSLKILAYIFDKDTLNITKGDSIHFCSRTKRIENFKDQKFDYKHYMKRQYVQYSAFIGNADYKIIDTDDFSFIKFCSIIRNKIINTLADSGIKEPELGLLKAMLLGVKDNLDTTVKNNYIAAGGIHFLAISGLHTGIVFILISFLLHNICRLSKSGWAFSILSIGLLWTYAIITGLPSSVLRASIILSFIIIGKYYNINVNLYNAIASSAFLILLFDPGSIFSPGFQLSYAAYSSIIYLYPKIYKSIRCKNKILNNIWRISAVSIAAQIGTLPLSIFYFHHIYSYSLLTNLCISVFIPIIIYCGFTSIFISTLIPGETLLSESLSYIIKFVNYIIDNIAHLPGAISGEINFSVPETIFIYIILAGGFMMVWYKKRKLLFIILMSALFICSYNSYKKVENTIRMEQNDINN